MAASISSGTKFPLRSTVILTAVGLVCIVVPVALMYAGVLDAYTAHIIAMGGINALMAISVNMIVGITGLLTLGQAGFLCIGAYTCLIFRLDLGFPLPAACAWAVAVTTVAGFLIGFPVLKLTGDYLAIVTLGFGEIIRVVFINLKTLTGGPNGRAFGTLLSQNHQAALFTVTTTLVIVLALLQNFLRSTYGRAIMACREDEIAANSNGIDIFRYKMTGFVIAAFIAGLAGSLYAMVVGMVQPANAAFLRSIDYLIYVVLGGMGSMTGSIIAAYVLTYLQEFLRFLQDYRLVIYPLILFFVMLFRPQGLLGMKEFSFVRTWDRITRRKESPPEESAAAAPSATPGGTGGQANAVGAGAAPEAVLSVENLSIDFGGLRAVNNFSACLRKGELVGLIGPNGAGKTTVFNMLSGVYTPTEGAITFTDNKGASHTVGRMKPFQLNRRGIARTFQNIRLFSNLSVEDNIRIALHSGRRMKPLDAVFRLSGFRNDEKRMLDETTRLLSLFKIDDKRYELARNLPYGEQRKLEIARALASNPSLLLLDEPAAGMNPQETEALMSLISFARKEFNLTILLIEHDMHLVMGICERIIVLDYGSIIAEGAPEDIRSNPSVIKAYLGEEAIQ
jgi:branched-chain amino acid transport system permease protein